MNIKSLVSVIIPAYNHENYIQDTIKSIINQTYQNIELIVIDDGSTDTTWQKICELKSKCEKRFNRVIFLTKENEGTCSTLNKLLDLAEGQYIYIIASDDIAKPSAIEKEVKFLDNNPKYALLVCDDEFIDNQGNKCYWDKNQNITYNEKDAIYKTFAAYLQKTRKDFKFASCKFGTYETLYKGNYIPNGYLIRKSIFDKIGYFTKEAPLEDYWLMMQISKYAKMKYLNEVLYSYRWHNTNTVKNHAKVEAMETKTREYEKIIFASLDKNEVLENIQNIMLYGMVHKIQGIPYIFTILSCKKNNIKTKMIKLFGIQIIKIRKYCKNY